MSFRGACLRRQAQRRGICFPFVPKRSPPAMTSANWPKIAVVGGGAVGGYFGGLLARAGAPVIFIGRQPFVDAVKQNGLFLDTVQFQERVKVEASTDLAAPPGPQMF